MYIYSINLVDYKRQKNVIQKQASFKALACRFL